MGSQGSPYEYVCVKCGVTATATNRRGPRRTKCIPCANAYQPTANEDIARDCEACGSSFVWRSKRGRPRIFCPDCRPSSVSPSRREFVKAHRKAERSTFLLSTQRFDCEWCGEAFHSKPRHQGNRFCCDGCRAASAESERKAASEILKVETPCKGCGTRFIPWRVGLLYCSRECERRIAWAKRSALRKKATSAPVDPLRVFDRDGWRCRLCGKATPKELRGTNEQRAPELDHIMPLSLGGDHSYANTQLACRACNLAKGARPAGQLMLFCEPI